MPTNHPCDQYGRFAQVEETLSRTIAISGWCLGELYMHLGQPDARLLRVRRSRER